MPEIIIPTPLRKFTGAQARVTADGATVGEALANLAAQYPDLRAQLYDDGGALRSFVNLFIGDEDVRNLQRAETPLGDKDVLSIVPAIAGGR